MGLKHDVCQWNRKLNAFCEKYDLIPSKADHGVYKSKLDYLTLLGIFVDDGLICFDNPDKLEAIMHYLGT